MLIVIGGMIGLGKTTLGEYIACEFDAKMYYESVDDNPILPLYYTASEAESMAKRYPFLLQLYFLNSRYQALKDASLNAQTGVSVIDRSIYEDWYFAKINYDLGRMSELEFSIYKHLLDNMMEELATVPKKAPDLMVYIKGSFESVISRITNRGRAFEIDADLMDYYKLLWEGYDDWLMNSYKASDVLVIDSDTYNVVDNLDDRKAVLQMVKDRLRK